MTNNDIELQPEDGCGDQKWICPHTLDCLYQPWELLPLGWMDPSNTRQNQNLSVNISWPQLRWIIQKLTCRWLLSGKLPGTNTGAVRCRARGLVTGDASPLLLLTA